MIKHLFKLIWNRKRSTSLLMIEVFLSFLVLFGVLAVFYYNYSFYTEPTGFEYKNIWNVELNWNTESDELVREKLIQLDLSLKNFSEIEYHSFCSRFSRPYSSGMWSTGLTNEREQKISTVFNLADDNFTKVLGQKVVEGRWFNDEDIAAALNPVVINDALRNEYFGENVSAVGKKIIDKNDKGDVVETYMVVGVIDHYKYRGEFEKEYPLLVQRLSLRDTSIDAGWNNNTMLLRVKPGTGVAFEEKLVKYIVDLTKGWKVKVDPVEQLRESQITEKANSILVSSSIAFFLILNVALGLMGVIWYSVNRRKSEIGLRRAIGATGKKISVQIIGEAVVLGTFAIIIGIVFAMQVPILSIMDTTVGIILTAIFSASTLIYLLITICSLYPSILASKIQPIEALHDE
ncbi:MAG: ABC transporter permease [Melioribacteraceae bacterium]|nr:ABC transporter permease [Melioribacteraceae bacterium]MCF8355587.1 ABC transporter permease [Melioribacteraceae bacterium]MCF8395034.1 ABC transporter permease [Melioribacteraceae bacterium]MCF8420488.1 ABC transporter permease [Melioribacteraceae bacterium]